jgi:hypothetical protein
VDAGQETVFVELLKQGGRQGGRTYMFDSRRDAEGAAEDSNKRS